MHVLRRRLVGLLAAVVALYGAVVLTPGAAQAVAYPSIALAPPANVTTTPYVPPTVTVVGPASGDSVQQATLNVTATGVVHSSSDKPLSLGLLVDGNVVDRRDCAASSATCSSTLTWDANAALGPYTMQVDFETDHGSVQTVPTTFSVFAAPPAPAPLPQTWFDDDAPTTPQYGTVRVPVIGLISSGSALTAVDMQLFVDDAPSGPPVVCPSTSPWFCNIAILWNTRGLTGQHVVQVRFDLSDGFVWTLKETYDIEPFQHGQTSVQVLAGVQGGHEVVEGWADEGTVGLPDAPVDVTVTDAVSKPRTYEVMTDQIGHFALQLGKAFAVTSKVTASLPRDFGSATGSYVQETFVTLACHLPTTIVHARKTTVTCTTTPAARDGSKVTLYFKYLHAGIHVLGHSVVERGKVSITFTTRVKSAKVQLWAYLSRTSTARYAFSRRLLARII